MIGVTILVFEILMIILFGIFLRTNSTATSSLTALDSALYFMLGTWRFIQGMRLLCYGINLSIGPR